MRFARVRAGKSGRQFSAMGSRHVNACADETQLDMPCATEARGKRPMLSKWIACFLRRRHVDVHARKLAPAWQHFICTWREITRISN